MVQAGWIETKTIQFSQSENEIDVHHHGWQFRFWLLIVISQNYITKWEHSTWLDVTPIHERSVHCKETLFLCTGLIMCKTKSLGGPSHSTWCNICFPCNCLGSHAVYSSIPNNLQVRLEAIENTNVTCHQICNSSDNLANRHKNEARHDRTVNYL